MRKKFRYSYSVAYFSYDEQAPIYRAIKHDNLGIEKDSDEFDSREFINVREHCKKKNAARKEKIVRIALGKLDEGKTFLHAGHGYVIDRWICHPYTNFRNIAMCHCIDKGDDHKVELVSHLEVTSSI
jgi:hypothetical protein